MDLQFRLTTEEVQELESLIRRELNGSVIELHHTRTSAFKHRIKQHQGTLEQILEKLDRPLREQTSPCIQYY